MTERLEWIPAISTPTGYPVAVTGGVIQLADKTTIPLSLGAVTQTAWGDEGSLELFGDRSKPVPIHIDAEWFSVREDRFFRASIDLPVQTLSGLLATQITDPNTGRSTPRNRLLIGFAPTGLVSVWVGSRVEATLLATYNAKEANPDWQSRFASSPIGRAEFVKKYEEEGRSRLGNPTVELPNEYWRRSAIRSASALLVSGGSARTIAWIRYGDGERQYRLGDAMNGQEIQTRAQAVRIDLRWTGHDQQHYRSDIIFDEVEALTATEALRTAMPDDVITTIVDLSKAPGTISVALKNSRTIVPLLNVRPVSRLTAP